MNNDKNPKNKLAEKIRAVTNVLVTVSRNPSVDELAAALGLTFVLGKLNKHATAVFSGQIPVAINFLEPEKTFENNADSLRDFIISLDKEKADRLRYKVDGDLVKVFITPYKTKITAEDLRFEEGDFNVELVLALGVDSKEDLDQAIAAHGRIFHNATVATLNINAGKDVLGTISWQNAAASSYSEMVAELAETLGSKEKPLIDEPVATAILTGVVSATDQFRNEKTSPAVMTLAADLMAKGANQQLIASELSAPVAGAPVVAKETTLDLNRPALSNREAASDEMSIGHGEGVTGESGSREVEFTPNAEPAVSVEGAPETDRLNDQRDRYNTARGEDALAVAQARLDETRGRHQMTMPERPSDAPLPPVPTPTDMAAAQVETQLDNLVGGADLASDTLDDLRQSVAEAAGAEQGVQANPSSPELSHGTPYVASGASVPLNSALLDNEPPSVRPFAERPDRLSPKAHVMIQPLANEAGALPANDPSLPLPPPPPLPMPDQLPPSGLPSLPPAPVSTPMEPALSPAPDLAPLSSDTPLGAVPPLQTMPMDNVKPASPIAGTTDNTGAADQFQIPGQ
ncbi:hypothetical protein FWG95_01800 [Candidatus Saccharibacteria bacterium]|nr:hypothetical protein [Candidatus Saccharibacteria bacterium]